MPAAKASSQEMTNSCKRTSFAIPDSTKEALPEGKSFGGNLASVRSPVTGQERMGVQGSELPCSAYGCPAKSLVRLLAIPVSVDVELINLYDLIVT